MAKAKAPHKRLPHITWIPTDANAAGNAQWLSRDGMLRLTQSNVCYGVSMPERWILWRFKGGSWQKVKEGRGRTPIEKKAREMAAEYDGSDD